MSGDDLASGHGSSVQEAKADEPCSSPHEAAAAAPIATGETEEAPEAQESASEPQEQTTTPAPASAEPEPVSEAPASTNMDAVAANTDVVSEVASAPSTLVDQGSQIQAERECHDTANTANTTMSAASIDTVPPVVGSVAQDVRGPVDSGVDVVTPSSSSPVVSADNPPQASGDVPPSVAVDADEVDFGDSESDEESGKTKHVTKATTVDGKGVTVETVSALATTSRSPALVAVLQESRPEADLTEDRSRALLLDFAQQVLASQTPGLARKMLEVTDAVLTAATSLVAMQASRAASPRTGSADTARNQVAWPHAGRATSFTPPPNPEPGGGTGAAQPGQTAPPVPCKAAPKALKRIMTRRDGDRDVRRVCEPSSTLTPPPPHYSGGRPPPPPPPPPRSPIVVPDSPQSGRGCGRSRSPRSRSSSASPPSPGLRLSGASRLSDASRGSAAALNPGASTSVADTGANDPQSERERSRSRSPPLPPAAAPGAHFPGVVGVSLSSDEEDFSEEKPVSPAPLSSKDVEAEGATGERKAAGEGAAACESIRLSKKARKKAREEAGFAFRVAVQALPAVLRPGEDVGSVLDTSSAQGRSAVAGAAAEPHPLPATLTGASRRKRPAEDAREAIADASLALEASTEEPGVHEVAEGGDDSLTIGERLAAEMFAEFDALPENAVVAAPKVPSEEAPKPKKRPRPRNSSTPPATKLLCTSAPVEAVVAPATTTRLEEVETKAMEDAPSTSALAARSCSEEALEGDLDSAVPVDAYQAIVEEDEGEEWIVYTAGVQESSKEPAIDDMSVPALDEDVTAEDLFFVDLDGGVGDQDTVEAS